MRRLSVWTLYTYFLAAKARLTNRMYHWLYSGYYRWLFDRHGALSRQVATIRAMTSQEERKSGILNMQKGIGNTCNVLKRWAAIV
jgi:hypothetical protein